MRKETMKDVPGLLRQTDTSIAVVGATDDPDKYGARIYRDLKSKGFRVFAVNPGRDTVDGDPAYASVADLPERPTIVDLVIPPEAGLEVLRECKRLDLTTVWIQPGAESDEIIEYLDREGFDYMAHTCIMVRSRAVA